MPMTVGQLKEVLELLDDDVEVRMAVQPSWPFEHTVVDAVEVEIEDKAGDPKEVLYLAEGRQIGYLPGAARDHICW